nr:hypothetical protein Iba_scaffold69221CG0010 [Ipomoea batatas]
MAARLVGQPLEREENSRTTQKDSCPSRRTTTRARNHRVSFYLGYMDFVVAGVSHRGRWKLVALSTADGRRSPIARVCSSPPNCFKEGQWELDSVAVGVSHRTAQSVDVAGLPEFPYRSRRRPRSSYVAAFAGVGVQGRR